MVPLEERVAWHSYFARLHSRLCGVESPVDRPLSQLDALVLLFHLFAYSQEHKTLSGENRLPLMPPPISAPVMSVPHYMSSYTFEHVSIRRRGTQEVLEKVQYVTSDRVFPDDATTPFHFISDGHVRTSVTGGRTCVQL